MKTAKEMIKERFGDNIFKNPPYYPTFAVEMEDMMIQYAQQSHYTDEEIDKWAASDSSFLEMLDILSGNSKLPEVRKELLELVKICIIYGAKAIRNNKIPHKY